MNQEPLAVPSTTALLMMECQKGVLDATGRFVALADRVREKHTIAAIARLLAAFRRTDRLVVHCLAVSRDDAKGRSANAPLLRASAKGSGLLIGSEKAQPVDPLAPIASDVVVERVHGVSPFHGTELDMILRNCGTTTVIATGVSLNLGVLGMVIEAVNRGYEVLLPTDAVAGVPADYEEAQLRHTYRLLARLTTGDEALAALMG